MIISLSSQRVFFLIDPWASIQKHGRKRTWQEFLPPAHHCISYCHTLLVLRGRAHSSSVRFLNNTSNLGSSFTFIIIFLCHQVEVLFSCSFWISVVILGCRVGGGNKERYEKERMPCRRNRLGSIDKQRSAVEIAERKMLITSDTEMCVFLLCSQVRRDPGTISGVWHSVLS